MSTPERAPDELERRIRSLEAERLRPVPGAPVPRRRPATATDVNIARREAHDLRIIEEHLAEVAHRRAVLEELEHDEEEPDDPQNVHTLDTGNEALSGDLCTNSGTTDPQAEEGTVEVPDALSGEDEEAC